MIMDDDHREVERGEGGMIIEYIVPADIGDTRPDEYEGDLDEDESDDAGMSHART